MNRRKLFGCPGSALALQFPALPFGARHTVDFCTCVTHLVLSVHLFSLFLHPPAVFLTSSAFESRFPRPLSNSPSSAVLCMGGWSLNLFPQKAQDLPNQHLPKFAHARQSQFTDPACCWPCCLPWVILASLHFLKLNVSIFNCRF